MHAEESELDPEYSEILQGSRSGANMFDDYSERAIRVLFISRLKAGKDGASTVALNHLLCGVLIEDQGERFGAPLVGIPLDPTHQTSIRSIAPSKHVPFFSEEVAGALLSQLTTDPSERPTVPATEDLALAPEAQHVLQVAVQFKEQLRNNYVEPLHIVAATLAEERTPESKLLREFGISTESVLEKLRA